jgi:serine/threonine-protein kinase
VLPFDADALGMLFQRVMHEPHRPVRFYRPDLPEAVGVLVDRCLEKDPTRRFQNVAELAAALVPFTAMPTRAQALAERIALTLKIPPGSMAIPAPLQSQPPPPLPSNRPSETGPTGSPWSETRHSMVPTRVRLPIALAAFSALTLLFVGGVVLWRMAKIQEGHAPQQTQATALAPPPAALTALPGQDATDPSPASSAPGSVATQQTQPMAPVATAVVAPSPTTPTPRKSTRRAPKPPSAPADTAPTAPARAEPAKPETGIPSTRD